MGKSLWFPHDFHARHDTKLARLRMEVGPVGDGIYWSLVEMLYEEDGYLFYNDIPFIAKTLNTTEDMVNKVVFDTQLFIKNGDKFYSDSLLERLSKIKVKSVKARISGRFGGVANANRTPSERLAIREDKRREDKSIYSAFESIWSQYPSKVGKERATVSFLASVKTEQDITDITNALNNYKLSRRVKEGFIQNGSTWFHNWRDWINYTEPVKETNEGQWGRKLT